MVNSHNLQIDYIISEERHLVESFLDLKEVSSEREEL